MTDRKKVLHGLEDEISRAERYDTEWNDCVPVWVFRGAYELLKEQEPVLLENQHKPYGHFTNANAPWISRCPQCGKKVEGRQTRFCKYCGLAVKWDA